jgi:hypothetical protein
VALRVHRELLQFQSRNPARASEQALADRAAALRLNRDEAQLAVVAANEIKGRGRAERQIGGQDCT